MLQKQTKYARAQFLKNNLGAPGFYTNPCMFVPTSWMNRWLEAKPYCETKCATLTVLFDFLSAG